MLLASLILYKVIYLIKNFNETIEVATSSMSSPRHQKSLSLGKESISTFEIRLKSSCSSLL